MNEARIIQKAKNTKYKHKDWYRGTNRSVYSIMGELANTGDFYLDFPKTYGVSKLRSIGYNGELKSSAVLKWLIATEKYDKLVIRFGGSERGTDKGILKVQTFIILKSKTGKKLDGSEDY